MRVGPFRTACLCFCLLAAAAFWMVSGPWPLVRLATVRSNRAVGSSGSTIPQSGTNQPWGPSTAEPATQARLVSGHGKLPLSFEANDGQSDARVKFLSRGRGYTMFLTGNEAVLELQSRQSSVATHAGQPTVVRQSWSSTLRL
jgi:hypothetical protein